MNNINIFNKYDIENKLKDFKEGQDYSISPTDEPNIKTYNFHNDKLRSVFRNDRVPVRITRETYDGKDYKYRGHFEEGKDYSYSYQEWQGNPPADENGWRPISSSMWKSGNGDYTNTSIHFRPLENNLELKKNGPVFDNGEIAMHQKYLTEFQEKKRFYEMRLIEERDHPKSCCEKHLQEYLKSGKREEIIEGIKKTISEFETKIQYEKDWLDKNANGSDYSGLQQENHDLRQQLAEVKKQLAEVLEELRKLKNNSSGSDSEKLEQQIIQNERLIKSSESVSVDEIKSELNKSQALMNKVNTTVSQNKDDKGPLPYVIGGSVLVGVAGIIGYLVVKSKSRYFAVSQKNKQNK